LQKSITRRCGGAEAGIPLVYEDGKEFENGIVIHVLGDNPMSAGNRAGGSGDSAGETGRGLIGMKRKLTIKTHKFI
jgi:hypothetical protein